VATVLVFGHERHITRLIEVKLKRLGHETWIANSLSDAMTWLDSYRPEILFLGDSEPGVQALEEYAWGKVKICRTAELVKLKFK